MLAFRCMNLNFIRKGSYRLKSIVVNKSKKLLDPVLEFDRFKIIDSNER